tara:strand:- start:660 stop:812 length:153 start_codon:yes stop_codon:yes gene_type:complete
MSELYYKMLADEFRDKLIIEYGEKDFVEYTEKLTKTTIKLMKENKCKNQY